MHPVSARLGNSEGTTEGIRGEHEKQAWLAVRTHWLGSTPETCSSCSTTMSWHAL